MNVAKVWPAVQNFITAQPLPLTRIDFHYMGGEPMLAWEEIQKLNAIAKEYFQLHNIDFSWGMTSNLIDLDEQKMHVMISEHAGIHCSIDGTKQIQDSQRPYANGRGSFDDVIKNIPFALNITPHDTARVTVTPESVYYLIEISEFILSQGFKVVGLFPAYNLDWTEETLSIWEKQIELCYQRYGKDKISTMIKYRGKKKEFNYCGAGKGLWALDVDGKLYHCHHLTNDHEHMIIDAAHATPEAIAEAIKISTLPPRDTSINEACKNCPALEFCNGGCWADNYLTNKSATSPAPIECTMRIATTRAIGKFIMPTRTVENSHKEEMKMCGRCNSCQNCYQNCDTCDECNTCQDCNTCQSCDTCESNCQTSCQSKCEDSCQSSCERKCQSCEDRCQERCDYHCEYGA